MFGNYKNWIENRQKRELEREILSTKETILHYLLRRNSNEAVEIFEDVQKMFTTAMERRLEDVSNEKELLEKFLS